MDPIYTCTHIHLTTHVYTHAHVLVSYVYERSVYVCNTYSLCMYAIHTCTHIHPNTHVGIHIHVLVSTSMSGLCMDPIHT